MASKLYWQKATISDSGGTSNAEVILGVVTEGLEITEEEETVTIEDNQSINISYTGRFVLETINTTFDGGSDAILDDSRINSEGATKARIKLETAGGTTATLDGVYLNGRKGILSSGQLGVKLNCGKSDTTDPITYA